MTQSSLCTLRTDSRTDDSVVESETFNRWVQFMELGPLDPRKANRPQIRLAALGQMLCPRMSRSNCSQVSCLGFFAFDGDQSIVPLLTRSSPSFSLSLRISKTTSALRTTLVVGILISTSCFGNWGLLISSMNLCDFTVTSWDLGQEAQAKPECRTGPRL